MSEVVVHGQTLQFVRGDRTWRKLRERCLTDLYFLAGVVLNLGDVVGLTEGMHRVLCRVFERKTGVEELDDCPYRIALMPRGTGKTTLISQAGVVQRILQNPEIAILIANERQENAEKILTAIKGMLQNELLRELFHDIIPEDPEHNAPVWNAASITLLRKGTRQEPTIQVIGVGGTVTGQHPDLVVCDDILSREAMENARRGDGEITGRNNRWVTQLVPLLNQGAQPFPEIWFVGTRWFRGDSYEFIMEAFGYGQTRKTWMVGGRLDNGEIQRVPVIRQGDLVIYIRQAIEHGRSSWPERKGYDIESLAKIRLHDPENYAANFQNDPSDDVTSQFKEAWLQFYESVNDQQIRFVDVKGVARSYFHADLDILVLCDPGGFGNIGTSRARGAVLVTGSTPGETPEHLLLEAYSEQVPFLVVAQTVVDFAVQYRPRKVVIEEAGQQAAFIELVKRLARERGVSLVLEPVKPESKHKDARIEKLEPWFQRGLIRIGRDGRFHEFREQYRSFPRGVRVDLLDILAYGPHPKVWRNPRVAQTSQGARQDAERQQYLARVRR